MLPFRKILWPTDFSEPSYEALKAANELAVHFSAQLLLVHVVSMVPVIPSLMGGPSFDVALYQQELEASHKKLLDDVIKQRVPKELSVRPLVRQGDAALEIVRVVEEEKADIIVIATHGHTGWRRLVFGAVAEKVVRHATCPVLTIYAPPETERPNK
jgi:universal stress protein A